MGQGGEAVTDTPRTYAAMHDEHDPYIAVASECAKLERELNGSNKIIRQQQLLDEENLMLKERIKRLEEVGDVLFENSYPSMWDLPAAADQKLTDQLNWLKAKEHLQTGGLLEDIERKYTISVENKKLLIALK